jgi:hypothetical protein
MGQLFERRDTRPASFYATVAALAVFLLGWALTGELELPAPAEPLAGEVEPGRPSWEPEDGDFS